MQRGVSSGGRTLYKKAFKSKLSGNEVYYTAYSLPVILKKLCSKLDCQNGVNLIPFPYEITAEVAWATADACRISSSVLQYVTESAKE